MHMHQLCRGVADNGCSYKSSFYTYLILGCAVQYPYQDRLCVCVSTVIPDASSASHNPVDLHSLLL
jgi:hypothetical protein